VVASGENGKPIVQSHPHSETAKAFGRIVRRLIEPDLEAAEAQLAPSVETGEKMVIAVPVTNGMLGQHFGHCEEFALFDVGPDGKTVGDKRILTAPPHEPGVLPRWLHEQGADLIIAGGMGARAQSLFSENSIKVVVGAPADDAEQVVKSYLDGTLETGTNICDH
jgi:predicted Fe-Mo cluster-binding NifX family protein